MENYADLPRSQHDSTMFRSSSCARHRLRLVFLDVEQRPFPTLFVRHLLRSMWKTTHVVEHYILVSVGNLTTEQQQRRSTTVTTRTSSWRKMPLAFVCYQASSTKQTYASGLFFSIPKYGTVLYNSVCPVLYSTRRSKTLNRYYFYVVYPPA